jgi:hypothetical protein
VSRSCDIKGCPETATDHFFYERGETDLRMVLHLHFCKGHGAGIRVLMAALDEETVEEKKAPPPPVVPGIVPAPTCGMCKGKKEVPRVSVQFNSVEWDPCPSCQAPVQPGREL